MTHSNMCERIIFNGTSYPSLDDLPADTAERIRALADQPIWEHLPDGLMLVVSTVNMMPRTWLTAETNQLPALASSAVSDRPNEAANTPSARRRRGAAALVDLYVSHYNDTLSPDEAEKLVGLAGDVPEQAAERLRNVIRPYLHGDYVDVAEFRDRLSTKQVEEHRVAPEDVPPSGFPDVVSTGYPMDMNPRLEYDGSHWRLDVPQALCVSIREVGAIDVRPTGYFEELPGVFLAEGRRAVRYVANEARERSITETGWTVYSGWTDDIPPPPSSARDAFQTAVTGNLETSMSSMFCGPALLIGSIAVVTIIGFLLVVLVFLLTVDLGTLFSF